MTSFELAPFVDETVQWIDATLDARLPTPRAANVGDADPGRLIEAMRYAVLSGGKRMRPAMCVAACLAAGGERAAAAAGACAVELVHAYSLVHDDLPAMDDDAERRGKPTVHVEFGEAAAILVGDALLTHAFDLLAQAAELSSEAKLNSIARLCGHAGVAGMVGGQARDLALGQAITRMDLLEEVHAQKTGGLYAAAAAMGALAAGAAPELVSQLEAFGMNFGIAFQHADDVLDGEQAPLRQAAAARLEQLSAACEQIADAFPASQTGPLRALAQWVLARGQRAAAAGA